MTRLEKIVLRDTRDAGGVRYLGAEWREDGGIVIEGQDLGPGVSQVFGEGNTEYEWASLIKPDAVAAMVAALGGSADDDVLQLLKDWSDAHGGKDPGNDLREAGVPIEFWSRVGD